MKISLKIRMMAMMFVIMFGAMSILGTVSYKMTSNALQKEVNAQLIQKATDTSKLIEKSIESVKSCVEMTSLNTQVAQIMKDTERNKENIDTAFDYIIKIKESTSEFMEVLVLTDSTGKVIIDTRSKNPNIDLGDRDYMKQALSSKSMAVSEVLISRFTSNPALFITKPIIENGEIIGTVVGSIKFSSISKYVKDIKIGEKGYAYMLDGQGTVVGHPHEEKILKENIKDSKEKSFNEIGAKMLDKRSGEGFYTYEGIYKYVAYEPADKWIVAVTADYNEYMAPAIKIRGNNSLLIAISSIIALLLIYFYMSYKIINPIKRIQKLMKAAGNGDLTVEMKIKNKDEIGELSKSFNEMIRNEDGIVKNVRNSAEQLREASNNMASSSEEISATTEEISATVANVSEESEKQNESILSISQVLVQLSSLVQLAQNRAESTSANANQSRKVADLGRTKVEKTIYAINSIKEENKQTAQILHEVNNLSTEVGGIVQIINGIAEQTSLLALNAAIEAARAGEHGKGFSVVAEEVKKLAEESNDRAKDISNLVDKMVNQTKNAVDAMERANVEVENGVKIVDETDEAFINILSSIENIVTNIKEILDITSDEVASSDKVVNNIDEIATVTENNSENCRSVSEAIEQDTDSINNLTAVAEEISAMSDELVKSVEKFKI